MQQSSRTPRPVRAVVIGGLYLAGLYVSPPGLLVFTALLGLLLTALTWIDLDTFRLPDPLTLAVGLLGIAMLVVAMRDLLLWHLAAGALGFLWLLAVELGYRRWRGRNGLGRGDTKLFGALGFWVGLSGLPPLLLVASLSGLGWALVSGRAGQADGRIAFGPWICLGGWVVWCLRDLWAPGQM